MKKHTKILIIGALLISGWSHAKTSKLFSAVAAGDFAAVEKQLQTEADLNVFTENGFTPLVIACRNGDDKMAALLIAYGADVNLPARDSSSPLIEAARQGLADLTELLLIHGANVAYQDNSRMNAYDYAVEVMPLDQSQNPDFTRVFHRLQTEMTSFAERKN